MKKIYIDGTDGIGWSIDTDRDHIRSIIQELGYKKASTRMGAHIVHNVWWSQLATARNPLKIHMSKNLLVTCSNFIDPHAENFAVNANAFKKMKKHAKAWLCPSTKQQKILDALGLQTYWFPFPVNTNIFDAKKHTQSKEELLERYDIPKEKAKGKVLIGSFQRDSLGNDLTKPKQQKNPDLLINILKEQDREKFLLILAGPRRHYLRQKCKENNIPYHFIGAEYNADDLLINALPLQDMAGLYSLIDLYMVTSCTEGGPKAVMEAPLMQTMIMSTNVGAAADFIHSSFVFEHSTKGTENYKKAVEEFIKNAQNDTYQKHISAQYKYTMETLNRKSVTERLKNIYTEVLHES